jgi:4a-hydroxytetrahydrobiopterin dehydratase
MTPNEGAAVLADDVVRSRLGELDGWRFEDGALRRQFEFADFVAAFGFMARVALLAEKQFHHPDWSNSWNRVDIAVTSHADGGVTEACFTLAAAIDGVA